MSRHKPIPPRLEMAQGDTLGPTPRRKRKLQVVRAIRAVLDSYTDRLVEHGLVPEEVLGDAQPDAEEWRRAEHVVVGDDAEVGPAVDHG